LTGIKPALAEIKKEVHMKQWKEELVRYFYSGIKEKISPVLGLEVEHFIIEKLSGRAVPYEGRNGIRRILSDLMKEYPGAEAIIEEDLLGFTVPDFNITLEPAAQFEISIKTLEDIAEIGRIYSSFRKKLENILSRFGYVLLNAGCQPQSPVAGIKMIPKKRYDLMDAHFAGLGTGGIEMMRGSASVQISIDYTSEEDFRDKIQAAYFYGPVFKLLCDNSPYFQGKQNNKHLLRTDIWHRVDPARCGILPDIFSPDYSFSDYADFIGRVAPIFLKKDGQIIPTGEKTVEEIFADRAADDEDIFHIISMVFPDVRLKKFLELRFADSVPLPFILAYCAMVKGLLYSREGLDYAKDRINSMHMTQEDILQAEKECMEKGWDAIIYGKNAAQQADEFLTMAQHNLEPGERPYLDAFRLVLRYGSVAAAEDAGKETKTDETSEKSI